jgi:ankyrin repeat protein
MLCSRLLRCGADVNTGDYDERTALHVAAADGNLAAVRLLVEHGGADLDMRDRRVTHCCSGGVIAGWSQGWVSGASGAR